MACVIKLSINQSLFCDLQPIVSSNYILKVILKCGRMGIMKKKTLTTTAGYSFEGRERKKRLTNIQYLLGFYLYGT